MKITSRHLHSQHLLLKYMYFFLIYIFLHIGKANRWRVCYQWGLPRIVHTGKFLISASVFPQLILAFQIVMLTANFPHSCVQAEGKCLLFAKQKITSATQEFKRYYNQFFLMGIFQRFLLEKKQAI